jgi:hypothetical protein
MRAVNTQSDSSEDALKNKVCIGLQEFPLVRRALIELYLVGETRAFFSYCPGGVPVFRGGEECREPHADAPRFRLLQALGLKEPVCQDRAAASQGVPDPLFASRRHSAAPRLPESRQ